MRYAFSKKQVRMVGARAADFRSFLTYGRACAFARTRDELQAMMTIARCWREPIGAAQRFRLLVHCVGLFARMSILAPRPIVEPRMICPLGDTNLTAACCCVAATSRGTFAGIDPGD